MDSFYDIVRRSSKFCFLLSFMFMAPLILQMDFVLNIWLKKVPDYAGIFCQLSIINVLVYITSYPIWHGIISSGNNKRFRIIDSFIVILIFPFTYFGLHYSPIGYICSYIFVNIFRVVYAMFSLRKLTGFPIRKFVTQSLLKILVIVIVSVPLPLYVTLNMSGWQGFLTSLVVFLAMFTPSVLFIGLNKSEREKLAEWVKRKFYFSFTKNFSN
jgi:hypothetical protein